MTSHHALSVPAGPAPDRPWLRHYQPGVPHTVDVPDMTVDDLLRRAAQRWPANDALVFFGARTTFGDLDRSVDRFARALSGMGVTRGDRVSLHLPTSPAFVIAFLGILRAGALAVPMNPLFVEREVTVLMRETGPRLSVCLDLLVPRVRASHAGAGTDGGLVVTGIQDSLPVPIRWLYPIKARREGRWKPVPHGPDTPNLFRVLAEGRAAGAEERFESVADPDDAAVLQPTGGTTGTPKAAVLSHRNLVANAHQVAAWVPGMNAGGDRLLCALPYFHIYGLTVAMNYSLLIGATQLLHPRFDPGPVLKTIGKWKPRIFPGAPIMYATLAEHPDVVKHDLSSIEACISGAAPLPSSVQERFERITGGRLQEGYGLTEASPVTHSNPIHGRRKLGSIGLPFPSTDARVVDLETGERVLGPEEIGELCIRGPQVMQGYWNRPDETATSLRDAWLYTGDVATVDEEGYFTIVDRKKDLILVGGLNVYPHEVEEVLCSHPAVAEAAVVGMPHERRGEEPRAYVVLQPGMQATAEQLLAHCRENLARYKVPAGIELRSELPKTMIGKVLRRVLIDEHRTDGQAEGTGAAAMEGGEFPAVSEHPSAPVSRDDTRPTPPPD